MVGTFVKGDFEKLVTFYPGQHCNAQFRIKLFQFSDIELSRIEKGESHGMIN